MTERYFLCKRHQLVFTSKDWMGTPDARITRCPMSGCSEIAGEISEEEKAKVDAANKERWGLK